MAMAQEDLMSAFMKRLQGLKDSRSTQGIMSRGAPVYNASSMAAQSGGGPQFGAPSTQPPPAGLAFNPLYAQAQRGLMQQMAQLGSESEYGQRRIGQDYQQQLSGMQRQLPEAFKGVSQRMADQGILRSGINVGQQAKVGENYQRGVEDIGRQRAYGLEDLQRRIMGQQQNIQSQSEGLQYDQARSQVEEALIKALEQAKLRQAQQQSVGAPIYATR